MPSKHKTRVPGYRRHKASGQAVVTFAGRDFYLGPHGSPESKAEYRRLTAEYLASGAMLPPRRTARTTERNDSLSVEQLARAFLRHLEMKHEASWIANNLPRYRSAMAPVREIYEASAAADFSPLKLQAVRSHMIEAGSISRKVINQRVSFIRRMFRWAVAQELVPRDLAHALDAVENLKVGEFGTREGRIVSPVEESVVWDTLPFMASPAAALVELLWWTGARPAELVGLRPCDIDRSGKLWTFDLSSHKTIRHGCRRSILFGPRAQAVLNRFLNRVPKPDPARPIFSPAQAMAEISQRRRRQRTSPITPSQGARRPKTRPLRKAGEQYSASSLRRAVERAVDAANAARLRDCMTESLQQVTTLADSKRVRHAIAMLPANPSESRIASSLHRATRAEANLAALLPDLIQNALEALRHLERLPHWHPYQLRHSAATRIRKEHGLDAARVILGHTSLTTSEVYAEVDRTKATSIMEQVG